MYCIIEVVIIKLKIYSQENYGSKAKPKFVFKHQASSGEDYHMSNKRGTRAY